MDPDADGVSSNDIVEDLTASQECSVVSPNIILPLRSPVFASDQPDLLPLRPLVSPNAGLGAAAMNKHEASHRDLGFSGIDPIDAIQAENVPGDLDLEDLTKRVAAGHSTPDELTQCQMSLHQADRIDGEWHSQSNETSIGNEECMTPITRGILEWIQAADFGHDLTDS